MTVFSLQIKTCSSKEVLDLLKKTKDESQNP